jgi:integrase
VVKPVSWLEVPPPIIEEVAVLYGSDPHTCPVRALRTWLETSGLVSGPLFRAVDRAGHIGADRLTARIVGERLKKIGARAGLDPQSYAAYSLRSGFATSAARANKSEAAVMRQGRWKSIPVARRYIRADKCSAVSHGQTTAVAFTSNPTSGLW